MGTDSTSLYMLLFMLFGILGTAVVLTVGICVHFKRREWSLPEQSPTERERSLARLRLVRNLILAALWVNELFFAALAYYMLEC